MEVVKLLLANYFEVVLTTFQLLLTTTQTLV